MSTDAKGNFTIPASKNASLMFSYTGFLSRTEIVNGRDQLSLSLAENPQSLESVVVVGYGSQKKINLSGAVAQVQGKDLMNRPVPNATGALQGVLPGVTVIRGSGQPGDEGYNIRIRGFSSSNNASALVLVDGIEQDLNLIDPNDIENISVRLKKPV